MFKFPFKDQLFLGWGERSLSSFMRRAKTSSERSGEEERSEEMGGERREGKKKK
jgi:hypothetical protein